MLVKGDKIKQVKEIPGFNYVGTEFEVDGFTDMKVQFHGAMGCGIMTIAEFEEYFEKVVAPPPKPKREWSEWRPLGVDYEKRLFAFEETYLTGRCPRLIYRSNCKKVQLRTTSFCSARKVITVESSCSPDDTFDLEQGLRLCIARMDAELIAAGM